jgi:hypothetical protein
MNCSICNKPINLSPSATERAKRYGGKPSDYENLFTTHSECLINKRNADVKELMQRINLQYETNEKLKRL